MNKIPHLDKINKDNVLNQNCIIINPIQVFERKKNTKYDEEEILSLAQNINLIVKYQKNIIIRKITPSLFFGKGQVQNFKIYLKKYSSNLLLINSAVKSSIEDNLSFPLFAAS